LHKITRQVVAALAFGAASTSQSVWAEDGAFEVNLVERLPELKGLVRRPAVLYHSITPVDDPALGGEIRIGLIQLRLGGWEMTIPQCLAKLSEATHPEDVEVLRYQELVNSNTGRPSIEVRLNPSAADSRRKRVAVWFRFELKGPRLLSAYSNFASPGSTKMDAINPSEFCEPLELLLMSPQPR
jgi:hypothetical protein